MLTIRFDRGWLLNLLEFCQVAEYRLDYYSVFAVPDPPFRAHSHPGESNCCWILWRLVGFGARDSKHASREEPMVALEGGGGGGEEKRNEDVLSLPVHPPPSAATSRPLSPRLSKSSMDESVPAAVGMNNASGSVAKGGGLNSVMTPTSIQYLSNLSLRPAPPPLSSPSTSTRHASHHSVDLDLERVLHGAVGGAAMRPSGRSRSNSAGSSDVGFDVERDLL